MLTIAKEHITAGEQREGKRLGRAVNAEADIHLFGQEVNPETFAVCKSDLFMKSEKGEDAERIAFGSTLSKDRHAAVGFDYLIACPAGWRAPPAIRSRCWRAWGLRFEI
jgi:type I restriction-modification system DNA methylase subunit